MASVVNSIILLFVLVAVSADRCKEFYRESAGYFYGGPVKYALLYLNENDQRGKVYLQDDFIYDTPRITGVKAYICDDQVAPHNVLLTYSNGYLYAERQDYFSTYEIAIKIEYVELSPPFVPLRNGTVLHEIPS